MANIYENVITLLIIKEMQSKTSRERYYNLPNRLKLTTLKPQVLVKCGAEEIHTHPGGIIKWCKHPSYGGRSLFLMTLGSLF